MSSGLMGDRTPPQINPVEVAEQIATEAAEQAVSSWTRIDTSEFLSGNMKPQLPTVLMRSDGAYLMYPGKTHSFYGESESCKSWVLQYETARLINANENVLYLDFEDDMVSVVGRLLALGATPEAINENLYYYRPEQSPFTIGMQETWELLMHHRFSLCVIDGVTQALSVFGKKSENNDDVAGWMVKFPETIAKKTGAAVGLIDHVTKANDNRGRFAIGAQAKLSAITGAAYMVELKDGFGRGKTGRIELRVAKDRPGAVRACSGNFRASDRTQLAASMVLDATDPEHIRVDVWAPNETGTDSTEPFRPTTLMEKASKVLEQSTVAMTKTDIAARMGGKKETAVAAILALISEGCVEKVKDTANSPLRSVRPYRIPVSCIEGR